MAARTWLRLGLCICACGLTSVATPQNTGTTLPIQVKQPGEAARATSRTIMPPGRPLDIPSKDVEHVAAAAPSQPPAASPQLAAQPSASPPPLSLPLEKPAPDGAIQPVGWQGEVVSQPVAMLAAPQAPAAGPQTPTAVAAPPPLSTPPALLPPGPTSYVAQRQSSSPEPVNPAPVSPPPTEPPTPPDVTPAQAPTNAPAPAFTPPPQQPVPGGWQPVPPGTAPPPPPSSVQPFWAPLVPYQEQYLSQADGYLRADGGYHAEKGYSERESIGFEAQGRLRLPDCRDFSFLGGLRYDFQLDTGDRFVWTFGGIVEQDLLQIAIGIDGILDDENGDYVGSGFIYLSQDLPSWKSRVGIWSTLELWDDMTTITRPAGSVLQVTTTGTKPYEQTAVFYSARLGPCGRWGEAYFAPGFEHDDGNFRLNAGYQGTIAEPIDVYVHYFRTFNGSDDWSLFAGLQLHFGCGYPRPWDFVMPQRIRDRLQRTTTVTYAPNP